MEAFFLNMVWPAIYVFDEFWRFWYLIAMTIVVETLVLWLMCRISIIQSFSAATIGNVVSGTLGTYVMMWGMILWHTLADGLVPHATFDPINWYATFILMCLGSVLIEVGPVMLMLKKPFRKLFPALLIGNLLTYAFIAYTMATKPTEEDKIKRRETIYYLPQKDTFMLFHGKKLVVDTAKMVLEYDKDDSLMNGYQLQIKYIKDEPQKFDINLKLASGKNLGDSGMYDSLKTLRIPNLQDTIVVKIEHINPDPNFGWTAPLVIDTIHFIKVKK